MTNHQTAITTLVLGVGNLLVSDEAIGIHVIRQLGKRYHLPDNVQILDGGTLGMDLLYHLEGIQNLLIVDAVEMEKEAGTLLRLEGEEVPSFLSLKMSPHQIGVPDMLFAAKLKGITPPNIVLWGIQPAVLEVGLELSPAVAAQLDTLTENLIQELIQWGHTPTPKSNH